MLTTRYKNENVNVEYLWAENAGEYEAGSIMEGVPENSNIHEVIEMAQDFDRWNVIVMSLRSRYKSA